MDAAELVEMREFIAQLLAERDDHAPFSDQESLMQSGRLDSLAVVKIVLFLESAFAIDFTRIEFDPQRFESIAELSALVAESRAAG
jgi:acyl carrier protein